MPDLKFTTPKSASLVSSTSTVLDPDMIFQLTLDPINYGTDGTAFVSASTVSDEILGRHVIDIVDLDATQIDFRYHSTSYDKDSSLPDTLGLTPPLGTELKYHWDMNEAQSFYSKVFLVTKFHPITEIYPKNLGWDIDNLPPAGEKEGVLKIVGLDHAVDEPKMNMMMFSEITGKRYISDGGNVVTISLSDPTSNDIPFTPYHNTEVIIIKALARIYKTSATVGEVSSIISGFTFGGSDVIENADGVGFLAGVPGIALLRGDQIKLVPMDFIYGKKYLITQTHSLDSIAIEIDDGDNVITASLEVPKYASISPSQIDAFLSPINLDVEEMAIFCCPK